MYEGEGGHFNRCDALAHFSLEVVPHQFLAALTAPLSLHD